MNCIDKESKKLSMAAIALTMLTVFVLMAGVALPLQAQTGPDPLGPLATTQKWTAGWDNFSEPLNYTKSNIAWSLATTTKKLTVTYTLVGANPSKLYQVGFDFICSTFPTTFGQFPVNGTSGGTCIAQTHQGVTLGEAWVEVGTVLTDINGNGSFKVVIGPIASGTYTFEFHARNGAGCGVVGGGGNGNCPLDFQSPGPTFGDTTTITVP